MKTTFLLLAASLAALPAFAAEEQVIDLGDGTTVRISDGRVSVSSSSPNGGSTSSSVSSTTVNGETVATVTTDVNGQRSTRRITIGPDGKAVVSEEPAASPSGPAKAVPGGWLGVHTGAVPEALRAQLELPEGEGLLVEFVADGGPAAKAGIQVNDLLLTLDGTGLKGLEQLRELLAKLKDGQEVSLGYLRKGKTSQAKAVLGARPAAPAADAKVAGEAARLLREGKGGTSSSSSSSGSVVVGGKGSSTSGKSGRSIIVTRDGETRVVEGSTGADPFESVLNDPNVPEEMKAQIRKAQAEFKKAREEAEKIRREVEAKAAGGKDKSETETESSK